MNRRIRTSDKTLSQAFTSIVVIIIVIIIESFITNITIIIVIVIITFVYPRDMIVYDVRIICKVIIKGVLPRVPWGGRISCKVMTSVVSVSTIHCHQRHHMIQCKINLLTTKLIGIPWASCGMSNSKFSELELSSSFGYK